MTTSDWALISVAAVQAIAMIILVCVTIYYAVQTRKMAKEMREQRLMASRPITIQKSAYKRTEEHEGPVTHPKYFSHFEIYNAGNGPAIELTVAAVTEGKDSYLNARRVTYMRAGDTPIQFHLSNLEGIAGPKTYYLVSEYQGILSGKGKEPWYQTWLPFKVDKASAEGEFYVTAGELEFKEVPDTDRIDNLVSWSKPK